MLWKLVKQPLFMVPLGIGAAYTGMEYIRGGLTSGNNYVLGDQEGKTYIVTGANSGIGRELTMELAMKKARVIMACRNKNKCLDTRREIVLKTKNKKVYCRMLDLSEPTSVHSFVEKLLKADNLDFDKIDGLILNAATKSRKYKKNSEGVELSLATNHFGHFLLLGLIMPKLLQQPGLTKIVFVGTDIAAKDSLILKLDALNDARYKRKFLSMTEELDAENGKYDMHAAYKYSKAMQLLFARELAERLKDTRISVFLADPGGTKSQLDKDEPSQYFFLTRWCSNFFGYLTSSRRSPEKAIYPILNALGDDYLASGTFLNPHRKEREWGANAENSQLRQMAWKMSEQWTKLADHFQRMEQELDKPSYFAVNPEQPREEGKERKSRKYFWLF